MASLLKPKYLLPAILLATQAYRAAHPLSIIFREPTLPTSYFSTADGKSGSCSTIQDPLEQLGSCEDIRFWDVVDEPKDGGQHEELLERRIVAGCDSNRKNWNTVMGPLRDPNPRGAFWVADVSADGKISELQQMTFEGLPADSDFHPLGFDIFPTRTHAGISNMFVVNHARDKSNILQFTVSPSRPTVANYVRTIKHRGLLSPNSIALTSNRTFYVTNDHFMTRRLPGFLGKTLPLVETMLQLPLGFLSYVEILDEGLPGDPNSAAIRHTLPKLLMPFPNGIALSPDRKEIAISSSSLAEVHLYKRVAYNPNSGSKVKGESLEITNRVRMPFAPDNVDYTDNGDLLVAGHPFFPSLVKVAANKTDVHAGSWVVAVSRRSGNEEEKDLLDERASYPASNRVNLKSHSQHKIQTIYQSNGHVADGGFGTSTTALRDERSGLTIVSGLYEKGLLVCRP
ncbi:hypothetical protein SCHPADRAFT_891482 [Schizopora paradoxa]|uniref:Calcium-dependent phosphotriesterase n=1 Tax=Schizopora paradoxa TaxID=27342 RepID=A0A0H2RQ09_9AGAM|nr:hypothetical protein SCHPADRAFT_891482 [Schizopora paradoxa]